MLVGQVGKTLFETRRLARAQKFTYEKHYSEWSPRRRYFRSVLYD
jgi:hypothetical protein